VPAHLHARLQQGELVGPGGEAAFAAEVVELAEQGDQGVVGALLGEVVVVAAAQVGQGGAAPRDLEAGGPEQQGVQLGDGGLALGPARPQAFQPEPRGFVAALGGPRRRGSRSASSSSLRPRIVSDRGAPILTSGKTRLVWGA